MAGVVGAKGKLHVRDINVEIAKKDRPREGSRRGESSPLCRVFDWEGPNYSKPSVSSVLGLGFLVKSSGEKSKFFCLHLQRAKGIMEMRPK